MQDLLWWNTILPLEGILKAAFQELTAYFSRTYHLPSQKQQILSENYRLFSSTFLSMFTESFPENGRLIKKNMDVTFIRMKYEIKKVGESFLNPVKDPFKIQYE